MLDVFGADREFGNASREALRACRQIGGLIACDVVWAETAAAFGSASDAARALERIGIVFGAISEEAALGAGSAWGTYRRAGGKRTRVIADFLIGAHSLAGGYRLLTRDRGFYRKYFEDLEVITPGDFTNRKSARDLS